MARGCRMAFAVVLLLSAVTVGCPARAVRLSDVSGTTDDPQAEGAFRRAMREFESGRYEEARQELDSFLTRFPADPLVADARLTLGRIALETGDVPRARQYFRELRRGDDQALAEQASFFDGLALERAGDHAGAIEALRPFAGRMVDPADAELLYRTLSTASTSLGDHVGALRWVDAVAQVATTQSARRAAEQRATQIVQGPLSAEGVEQALRTLPRGGVAWPLVVQRSARDALDVSDFARATEMLALLRDSIGDEDQRVRDLGEAISDRRNVDPHVIGAVLPLSGRAREVGAEVLRGLYVASEGLQEGVPEGQRFRLVVRDDAGDPERAAAAVDDLVQTEHVIGIIGSIEGGTAQKAAERAQSYSVPILLLSPRDDLPAVGPHVFRAYVTNASEASILAAATSSLGIRDVAIVHPDIPYGRALRDAFAEQVSAAGARVVGEARYAPGTRTFTDTLSPLRNVPVQAIFLPCPAADVRLLAPALAAAGFWSSAHGSPSAPPAGTRATQLLLPSVGIDAETVRVAGRYLQGAVVSTPFEPPSLGGAPSAFSSSYSSRFSREPSFHAAFAHDAWQLIRAAVERGASSRAALRDDLARVRDARGVTAMRGFGEDREPLSPVRLERVDGIRLAPLE
ncbi:MAG: ABC transporter substrate-binding protein [Deltaproteobacteria bacterium]|nr:ABC transporter substrate-binding protein [Deltaproteobacteria bacterium]